MPQLVKRFGKSYTVEEGQLGKTYKFRSASVSVDAVVSNGRSICEIYYSDHPLTAGGEPPNDIVRAVLKTNVPEARWLEIDAAQFGADYALRSSDGEYVAILNYTGPQPENMIWTMTVGRGRSVQTLSAATTTSPSPASTAAADERPVPPLPTPSPSEPGAGAAHEPLRATSVRAREGLGLIEFPLEELAPARRGKPTYRQHTVNSITLNLEPQRLTQESSGLYPLRTARIVARMRCTGDRQGLPQPRRPSWRREG